MGLFSKPKKEIIRSTEEAESLRNQFRSDYNFYSEYENSEEFKHFTELEKYVKSAVFLERRKKIEQLKYKRSECHLMEKKWKKLSKNSQIQRYYKIKNSPLLEEYLEFKKTEEYENFKRLYLLKNAKGINKKKLKKEYKEFKAKNSSPEIKKFIDFENSKDFRKYAEVDGTKLPKEYEELKVYIESEEFTKNKEYLLNKKRYYTTDDYKLLREYEELRRNEKVIKYFVLKEDRHFQELFKWELAFEDDFRKREISEKHWITKYYAGERFLKDTYGVEEEVPLFTDENVVFNGQGVNLVFKKENLVGKYWDKRFGIREKEYEYTSGMLSSASKFQQSYGRFEAKIKLFNSEIKQYFWMQGINNTPHIRIMEHSKDGLYVGCIKDEHDNIRLHKVTDLPLKEEYYIFTLEWNKYKMLWLINDMVVFESPNCLPTKPMYLAFSLTSTEKPKEVTLPVAMQIDWVRFYRYPAS